MSQQCRIVIFVRFRPVSSIETGYLKSERLARDKEVQGSNPGPGSKFSLEI